LGQALEKAVDLCGMACCHDAEASPVYTTCRAFSPNSFYKNPQYSYAGLLIHRLAMKKKFLLKNWLIVQENRQHALEVGLHLPQLSWVAGG